MTLCGENTSVNHRASGARAVTLRCRSWHCDLCAPDRQRRLVAMIAGGHPQRLLTLTVKTATKDTPEAQARFMALSFRRLVRMIRSKWPDKAQEYFVVFEAHKSGWPHMHVALRGSFIPWAWLSLAWCELTGSPGVDIRFVRNPRECASYVAKYMGKDTERFGTCKRYWSSKNWEFCPAEQESDDRLWSNLWEYRKASLRQTAEIWHNIGWSIWMEGTALHGGRDPPKDATLIEWFDV